MGPKQDKNPELVIRKEDLDQVDVFLLCDLVEEFQIALETGNIRRKEKWMSAAQKYAEARSLSNQEKDILYFSEVLKKKWDLEKYKVKIT